MYSESAKRLLETSSDCLQLVTARCGELLVGLDLSSVQEINRQGDIADVPEVPSQVRGVLNLRGEVITMIDLRAALRQTPFEAQSVTHNVFVRDADEVIGLVTDGVSDIVTITADDIDSTPANIRGADSLFFSGVHQTRHGELVMILDLPQLLDHCAAEPAGTFTGD